MKATIIRTGYYCVLKKEEYILIDGENGWRIFKQGMTKSTLIEESAIDSAYTVYPYLIYKGRKLQIEQLTPDREGYVTVFADDVMLEELGRSFRDDVRVPIPLAEVTTIFEERTPLLDFAFTVEPVVYLKGEEC